MITIGRFIGINDDGYVKVAYNIPGKFLLTFKGAQVLTFLRLDPKEFDVKQIILPFITNSPEEAKNLKLRKEIFNIIFNEICDPDSTKKALSDALRLVKDLDIPIINHPKDVLQTSRDKVYKKCKNIKGIIFPKTVRIKPFSTKEVLKLAEKKGIIPPFIVREVGKHTNTEATLIKDKKDLKKLEKYAFDGREFFITQFIDYKSDDGFYRKYRVFIIDGKLYPRHKIVSDYWNIHSTDRKRVMDKNELLRKEEELWLELFNEKKYLPLKEIHKKLNLDYMCIDFSKLSDGRLLIFEATPCCKYYDIPSPKYKYHTKYIDRITNAIVEMIKRKTNTI